MDRRGFLKGILVAPVTVGIVGATKTPAAKQTVIEIPTKPAHLMAIFSAEVDSQKKRNLYGKTVVLVDKVGFDTDSVQIQLDSHQGYHADTHVDLMVRIKEPGKKGQILMDILRFGFDGSTYYLPLWIKKGSKLTVRVKDNRKNLIGGYTCRILMTGGNDE